jgi:hypothetical protein
MMPFISPRLRKPVGIALAGAARCGGSRSWL